MINDGLSLTGALEISVNGSVTHTKNLVVDNGKAWVAQRMKGDNAAISHMALGSSTTAAAAGDTALGTESDRNALATAGGSVANNIITFEATWSPGDATGSITEAGLFDAATGGDLLARTVFPVVNKGAADTMTITWSITVS